MGNDFQSVFKILELLFTQGENGTVLLACFFDHSHLGGFAKAQFEAVFALEGIYKSIDVDEEVFVEQVEVVGN